MEYVVGKAKRSLVSTATLRQLHNNRRQSGDNANTANFKGRREKEAITHKPKDTSGDCSKGGSKAETL